jgi:hypothetical protein
MLLVQAGNFRNGYYQCWYDVCLIDRWELRLRVILAQNGNLTIIPRVRNMNLEKRDMTFTFALQAHFNVSDVGYIFCIFFSFSDLLNVATVFTGFYNVAK